LTTFDELFHRCSDELKSLKARLDKDLGRKSRLQALIWPLKQSDVDKTLDSLGKLQQLLVSALDVDQTYVVLATVELNHDLRNRRLTLQIHAGVEVLQEHAAKTSQSIEHTKLGMSPVSNVS
jgi:hypothetical protein